MGSYYQKEHRDYLRNTIVVRKGEAFNLEKETKIINPHRVESTTVNRSAFTKFDVEPRKKIIRRAEVEYKPAVDQPAYSKSFPNWNNG